MSTDRDIAQTLREAITSLNEEIEYLQGQGYSGTWIKKKEGTVKRLKSVLNRLEIEREEAAREQMELQNTVQKLSDNTDKLFLLASIFLDDTALAHLPLHYSKSDLENPERRKELYEGYRSLMVLPSKAEQYG